ncbi:hypothetical protein QYF36_010486 [Acer negundo]|nr:hypothetical protein QYF36_010486 [Acer negundo]
MGHHRFLPKDRVLQNQMSQFNGEKETGDGPKRPASDEVFTELQGINDPTWSTSIEIKPINLYEMPMDEDEPFQEEHMQCTNINANLDDNHEDEVD